MQLNKPALLFLGSLSLLLIGISFLVYLYWFELIIWAQSWQRYFHQQLIQCLIKTKQASLQTGVLLLCFSFLYGILHSAGPGHGKIIISTYLATQPKQLKKSLLLTLLSAIMQGLVAMILITLALAIFRISTKYLTIGEYRLEQLSYILITLVGLLLSYRAIRKLIPNNSKNSFNIIRIVAINQSESLHQQQKLCRCCNHRHLPNQQELEHNKGWLGDLGIILAIGIRPCSGALLVLIFSYSFGVYYWGIAATFAMSIGTALTISLFALLVHYARQLAKQLMIKQKRAEYTLRVTIFCQLVALLGGILLIIIGLILLAGMSSNYLPMGNPLLAK